MPERPRLGGRYELGDVLGFGGMAEVHLGRDVRLGREVAVKTLRADLARDPAFQSRFRREAQSAASLNHQSIVAVYDTGEDQTPDGGRAPYIVMEYVDGRTLRDILQTDGRLLPRRALEITADILGALDYSHRAGIVHRDMKPGNVMVTRAGDVKVMDFGIARALTGATSTMTQTAAVIGTAQYLSPEQARGEHVDGRSDIYSIGCVLYELLTGRPPFVGDSPIAVAYQHVREDPVPPSQVDPEIPAGIDAIVLKAMAKNPANRYQTAAEMKADVERAIAGRPVEATPILADAPTTVMAGPATTQVLQPVPARSRSGRNVAYGLLALAVIAVFVVVALVAKAVLSGTGSNGLHAPDLRGDDLPTATAKLNSLGLKLGQVFHRYSSVTCKPQYTAGQVCDQSPEVGIQVHKGNTVNLYLSRGSRPQPVPNIVGELRGAAIAALHNANLVLGTVTTQDSPEPQGTVLAQDPTPGAKLGSGRPVNIVVASGTSALPNVVGQSESAATSALHDAGFNVVVHMKFDPADAGNVIRESPPGGPGATAPQGSTVEILVARGPSPTPTPKPTPSGSPSPSPSPTASVL
jgi:beta-lactam-binding protein with PASTA domain/predicted Ser/Thr protein kinase